MTVLRKKRLMRVLRGRTGREGVAIGGNANMQWIELKLISGVWRVEEERTRDLLFYLGTAAIAIYLP